jgi:hypothetical protein
MLMRLPMTPIGQLGEYLPDRWQAARQAQMVAPQASVSETPTRSAEPAS